jgi:hypothetical protein
MLWTWGYSSGLAVARGLLASRERLVTRLGNDLASLAIVTVHRSTQNPFTRKVRAGRC